MPESRRSFLQSAAIASGAGLSQMGPMPTVRLGNHTITRLIVGSNPFYGYSHFNPILDSHMREWYTTERVLEVLRRCEAAGIGTWQLHYSDRAFSDLRRYKDAGGKMNWVLLSMGELMKQRNDLMKEVVRYKPIGVVHHGGVTDNRFRDGETQAIRDFLKWVRDAGVMAGMSAHNPAAIAAAESGGWETDFYMTCFYRVSRNHDEMVKEFGEAPIGETYFEKDPVRMCAVVRQTKKTCLGFKILAAGRNIRNPQAVDAAFRFAYESIKPQDAVIVGTYPRFRDEVEENAARARKFGRS